LLLPECLQHCYHDQSGREWWPPAPPLAFAVYLSYSWRHCYSEVYHKGIRGERVDMKFFVELIRVSGLQCEKDMMHMRRTPRNSSMRHLIAIRIHLPNMLIDPSP
jgi:hypothetical protein